LDSNDSSDLLSIVIFVTLYFNQGFSRYLKLDVALEEVLKVIL